MRKSKVVYVNGLKHGGREIDGLKDAALTCMGTPTGVAFHIAAGLPYNGFCVSYEPDVVIPSGLLLRRSND
jgi:hypothetical protein